MSAALPGPDGLPRCGWCLGTPGYIAYHDDDWGRPVKDDVVLFEKLSLEAFQSGLSWRTILDKRDNFRRAFAGFDPARVAAFTPDDVERLVQDAGIVRHRAKIEATLTNARGVLRVIADDGSFARFVWRYEPVAGQGAEAAKALSKALKTRGFAFVGATTIEAFLQAAGLVNDHAADCTHHAASAAARAAFVRP